MHLRTGNHQVHTYQVAFSRSRVDTVGLEEMAAGARLFSPGYCCIRIYQVYVWVQRSSVAIKKAETAVLIHVWYCCTRY